MPAFNLRCANCHALLGLCEEPFILVGAGWRDVVRNHHTASPDCPALQTISDPAPANLHHEPAPLSGRVLYVGRMRESLPQYRTVPFWRMKRIDHAA